MGKLNFAQIRYTQGCHHDEEIQVHSFATTRPGFSSSLMAPTPHTDTDTDTFPPSCLPITRVRPKENPPSLHDNDYGVLGSLPIFVHANLAEGFPPAGAWRARPT